MSNNNYSTFHYANASNYNAVPITYVTVANAGNAFQPAAIAAGGRIVNTNYTGASTSGNSIVGPIGGGGGVSDGNATSATRCYQPVLRRPILTTPLTYDVTKTYYQQSAPPNYAGVTNMAMGKVHYSVPPVHKKTAAHLIGPKIPKNFTLTMSPNKTSKSSSSSSSSSSMKAPGGVNTNSSTIAPSNYNANLYNSAAIYSASVAAANTISSATAIVSTTANSTAIVNKLAKQQQQTTTSMNVASTSKIYSNSNCSIANSSIQSTSNLTSVPLNVIAENNIGNTNNTNHYIASNLTVTAAAANDPNHVTAAATNSNSPWAAYRRGNSGSNSSRRSKSSARPQQLHYCEVCKISCAGPQTYREHLEGQKHKKREASLKLQASAQSTAQNRGNNYHCDLCDVTCTGTDAYAAHIRGSKHQKVLKLHQKLGKPIPPEDPKKMAKINFIPATTLNNVTDNTIKIESVNNVVSGVTGAAAAATVTTTSGYMKKDENHSCETIIVKKLETGNRNVVNLPIKVESNKMAVNTSSAYTNDGQMASTAESFSGNSGVPAADMVEIKPVGGEYIEELKDKDGRTLSFNCKLCDCKFNDPNAKEMHMKGRRHRLQYKRKVQPDLIVDFKPTLRQRRAVETRVQRALMQGFNEPHENTGGGLNRNVVMAGNGPNEYCSYWEEQRRRTPYDEEYDYNNWMSAARGFGKLKCNQRYNAYMANGPPYLGIIPSTPNIRRPESSDDRHAIARHAEIYPKEQELQMIQRIVSHTERALKFVSDTLAEGTNKPSTSKKDKMDGINGNSGGIVKDGRDNQMLSFQKEADLANMRILKGVMRVGFLAKGLLLQGDKNVELVVLCGEKPTVGLLKRVFFELPQKLKEICGENQVNYKVHIDIEQSAVMVNDDHVGVKITLTSPLLRDEGGLVSNESISNTNSTVDTKNDDTILLPRKPCLKALAELRHAKWFQARATGLQSCVMVLRILRDLCRRSPAWLAIPQWSMELFVEKVISSAGFPISPGDCLRRIMESFASGFLINGPGLIDPCEREHMNALQSLTMNDCEKITCSAQQFLRFIAFRQIHRVLGMEQLPSLKFPCRPWRVNRKRRRQSGKVASVSANSNNTNTDADDPVTSEKIPKRSATETST